MKVQQMTNAKGTPVKNQFILYDGEHTYFQSYNSIIVHQYCPRKDMNNLSVASKVTLDETYWNYSRTTSKYRNLFLGESTQETQRKIDTGEYQLVNLN